MSGVIKNNCLKDKNRTFRRGCLYIISAPSGAGKTTLCKAVLERFQDMHYSVSYTTRKPRKNERDGTDYYFIDKENFIKGIKAGKWAEWAEVYGSFYGTSARILNAKLASGHDILLDIDIQGTKQILALYPDSVTFFILPPSIDVLRRRLETRGSENKKVIEKRLIIAEKEIAEKEIYKHIIINDELTKAIVELTSMIETYRSSCRIYDSTACKICEQT